MEEEKELSIAPKNEDPFIAVNIDEKSTKDELESYNPNKSTAAATGT